MDSIVSNCPLCEEHSLHLITGGSGEIQLMQCIWCGYVSSGKFNGTKANNKEYKKLTDDMKGWAKEAIDRVWIPSMFTLPDGMIYPDNVDNKMKWKLADLVDIPEKDQKNYPMEGESDKFYDKRYATEKPKIYDYFYEVMSVVNERVKNKAEKENKPTEIKLPKLSKVD